MDRKKKHVAGPILWFFEVAFLAGTLILFVFGMGAGQPTNTLDHAKDWIVDWNYMVPAIICFVMAIIMNSIRLAKESKYKKASKKDLEKKLKK